MPIDGAPSWDDTIPAPGSAQPAKPAVMQGAAPSWDETTAAPSWDETAPAPGSREVAEKPSSYDRATSIRSTPKGGALASEKITDDEIQTIAKQTGTDPQKLKEFTNYFGVFNEGEEDVGSALKALAGQAGKMAFGIPQKLMKLAQDDKYEEALDILGSLAGQKQSYFLDAAGILGGPNIAAGKAMRSILPAQKVKEVAKGVGVASGVGVAAGVAQSDKDKELMGGLTGGVVGAAVAAPIVTMKVMKQASKWSDAKLKQGLENIRANGANLEDAYQAALPARAAELSALKQAAKSNVSDFTKFDIPENVAQDLVSPETLTAAMTAGTAENKLLAEFLKKTGTLGQKVVGESDSALVVAPRELDKALAFLRMRSLSKDLKRTYGSTLTELQKTRSADDVANLLDEHDKLQFSLQAVAGKGFEKKFNPLERIGYNVMAYTSDSKPFLQVLDDRYGTSWELIADNASKKMNLIYGAGVRKWAKQINEIAQASKDPTLFQKVVAEVESGTPTSPEGKYLAEFFEAVRNDANEQGANIQKLKGGYFPKLRKSPAEYIRAYRAEADRIQQQIDFSDLTDDNIKKLMKESPEFNSFVNETMRVSDLGPPTAENFQQAFKILNGDIAKTRQALNMKSFATQQRSDTELPTWARELDPAKAASRWVTNTYKFLALKDELAQLASAEQIARKAKDNVAGDYLRNLRQDWMGGRTDTVASWGKKQAEKWQISMDAAKEKAIAEGNKSLAGMYEGAKDLPDMFIRGQNNLYTNALGLSPKAAMQNLASFYTQNFPELGHATSVYYTSKALPKLGNLIRKGQLGEFVYSKGLIDKDWTGEAANVLSGNLRKSLIRQVGAKAAEKYSQTVMAAFKGSELTARAMSGLIAEEVAQDVLNSTELRNKLVTNMKSSAYRRLFIKALESRDAEGIKKVLTSYMNSNNMYNYNKLNQAEFARSLGPMFSIFSKWPSMAMGTQMKDFLSGGGITPAVTKNMRLLYMPYLTMYLADKVIDQTVKPMVGDQRYESVMGKKGLHGMMVTDATPTGVFERGGILASPAVRAANTVAKAIVSEGDYGQTFSRAFKDLSTTYVPVLPLVDKVMNRELPRLIYNQPPVKDKSK